MKYKYLFMLLLTGTLSLPVFTQVAQSRINHEKYWYARHRLKTKFMKIGLEEGESLPGGIRQSGYYENFGQISALDFGDGTIYLGWYIGVLATEIHLLKSTGQDYTETARELYHALMAFDRLDMNAEILWSNWNGVVPNGNAEINNDEYISHAPWNAATYNWDGDPMPLNGFFCRNDAPPRFENQFNGEYSFVKGGVARLYNSELDSGYLKTTNKGERWIFPPYNYITVKYAHGGSEASHDQIFSLFMGMLLTHQFASGVEYNGVNLAEKAKKQVLRMVNHYEKYTFNLAFLNPMKNPPYGGMPFNGGGNSYVFAFPIAVFANYIDNGIAYEGFPYQTTLNNQNSYWDSLQLGSSKSIWYLWNWDPNTGFVNHHLRMMMAALSNTFKDHGGPQKLYNMGVTNNDIGWEFYYLLNKALYPNNTDHWDPYAIRDELFYCPCTGPYAFNTISLESYPWNISNRFVFGYKNIQSGNGNSDEFGFLGEYNGLDYMLLYNLFSMVYSNYNSAVYANHIDRKLTNNPVYPFSGTWGSVSDPQTFIAFKTLETNMTINGPADNNEAGDISLKAGESITMLPGFYAKAGSSFYAYISNEFDCSAGYFKKNAVDPMAEESSRMISAAFHRRADSLEEQSRRVREEIGMQVEQEPSADIILLPNPAQDIFSLRFDDLGIQVDMATLYDNTGHVITEYTSVSSGQQIDISFLSPGLYHFKVRLRDISGKYEFKVLDVIKI